MGRAHRTPRQQGTGFEGREPTQMTGTGGTRRSGGPAGVSTTDQEHGRATPETPGVRVHTLTAEEKGAWVDDINARMAALAPIERRAAAPGHRGGPDPGGGRMAGPAAGPCGGRGPQR